MSLLTSTTIILDHVPYEPLPSAKTFSPVEDELVQHPSLENVHVTWTHAVSHAWPTYKVLLGQIRIGCPRIVSYPGSRPRK
jgi:hypothetical protein